jgi:hypothetical protein
MFYQLILSLALEELENFNKQVKMVSFGWLYVIDYIDRTRQHRPTRHKNGIASQI